ncbi:hypothetical protein PHISCL_04330 [Aspergillus sclerotialis]|uniref:Uncharacterized protein n=1 Tax=Aspergillus sclerotialis TaxID=2070753 RepID=A0A3A2ZVK2_9EURO|nr:hypothetical protein PHISCL_04330 [Aspergillus sclerotialis]
MTQPAQSLPDYEILGFSYGVGTESELTILCYGIRFYITISADNFGNSKIANEYLNLLKKLKCEGSIQDDENDPMETLCFWIALTCNSQMRLFASASEIPRRQPRTLYDWFNPKTIVLIPKVVNDNTMLVDSSIPSQQLLEQLTPRVRMPPSYYTGELKIPAVQTSQILLQQNKA